MLPPKNINIEKAMVSLATRGSQRGYQIPPAEPRESVRLNRAAQNAKWLSPQLGQLRLPR
jgi:hypothetical protein